MILWRSCLVCLWLLNAQQAGAAEGWVSASGIEGAIEQEVTVNLCGTLMQELQC